jgi:hypothetical protein
VNEEPSVIVGSADRCILIVAKVAQCQIDRVEAMPDLEVIFCIGVMPEIAVMNDMTAMFAGRRIIEIAAELKEDLTGEVIVAEPAQQRLDLESTAYCKPVARRDRTVALENEIPIKRTVDAAMIQQPLAHLAGRLSNLLRGQHDISLAWTAHGRSPRPDPVRSDTLGRGIGERAHQKVHEGAYIEPGAEAH